MNWSDPICITCIVAIVVLLGILLIYLTSDKSDTCKSSKFSMSPFIPQNARNPGQTTLTVQSNGNPNDPLAGTYVSDPSDHYYVSLDSKYFIVFATAYRNTGGILYTTSQTLGLGMQVSDVYGNIAPATAIIKTNASVYVTSHPISLGRIPNINSVPVYTAV